jgi:hypothetical protein
MHRGRPISSTIQLSDGLLARYFGGMRLQAFALDFIHTALFARVKLRDCGALLVTLVAVEEEDGEREEEQAAYCGADADSCFGAGAETGCGGRGWDCGCAVQRGWAAGGVVGIESPRKRS